MTETFPYKPRPWLVLLVTVFGGVLTGFMAWHQLAGPGRADDGEAVFNGLIGLVAFLCLVPAGLFQFQRGIRSKAAVTITWDEVSAPQGAFGRVRKTIRLDRVEQVSRYRGKGIDSVSIGYHGNWISLQGVLQEQERVRALHGNRRGACRGSAASVTARKTRFRNRVGSGFEAA